jgi:hypothetical protein
MDALRPTADTVPANGAELANGISIAGVVWLLAIQEAPPASRVIAIGDLAGTHPDHLPM